MVGAYTTLPPAVAATVPRRTVLRDSWILQRQTSDLPPPPLPPSAPSTTSSGPASLATTHPPPMTPSSFSRNPKLGELRQKWNAPRPASVVLTTYSPPGGGNASEELQAITGNVSKAKAFFESSPLQSRENDPWEPRQEEPCDTVVNYRVKHPHRSSPRPKPRRYRNTISTFPRWVSSSGDDDDSAPKNDSDSAEEGVQVLITGISPSTSGGGSPRHERDRPPAEVRSSIEITRLKPSFIRRRYGTVTGLITDRANVEEALRMRFQTAHSKYLKGSAEQQQQDTEGIVGGGGDAGGAAYAAAAAGVFDGSSSVNSSGEFHRARKVAVVSATKSSQEILDSRGLDGALGRRVAAPFYSPRSSCRCDHATAPTIVVVSSDEAQRSECQGSAAEERHVSPPPPQTMIVLPEDGQVQAASGPRVVAACIKSYHDIPEELFNSLQESSVDPQTSPSPPPPPPPSSSPPTQKPTPSPTPAPRSDWKTMREGRKALMMGEVSDADTEEEEGSEADTGGVASTSDYHTSDGRGSSLSGASDDHHHHRHDSSSNHHHKGDFSCYHSVDYNADSKDADEEGADFECYDSQVSTPTVLIKNNFRGFCSAMLGSPALRPHSEYGLPPARPPPPSKLSEGSLSPTPSTHDQRSPSASSLLEEELRAAGIYFRRPGSPPRVPSRSRTLSPPPRPPSSLKLERSISSPPLGEAEEAVAAALHVLDASLAGLSDSSGESSPARSHASTVVENRRSQQCSLDPSPVDTLSPAFFSSSPHAATTTPTTETPPPPPHSSEHVVYNSDLNDSDTSSAVDCTYESGLSSTCSTEDSATGFSGISESHASSGLRVRGGSGGLGGGIIRGGRGRASSNVGGIGEHGGPYQGPHHQQKDQTAMENFNLIEEVYVDTRPVPRSTVSMRAYYPGVHYDSSSSSSSPKSSLKPPSTCRHPERGASLDSTQTVPADSDSGHESGATSPCGTLILDDTQSPPPSPYNNHTLKTQPTSTHAHNASLSHSRTSSLHSCRGPGVLEGEVGVAVVGDPTHTDVSMGGMALDPRPPTHFVVVAIDFGTTYSGYAFSFTRDPDSIHMMKKWEGGDPGVQNQKTPTIVLLTPDEEFHSMGFIARDTYHDLDPKDAYKWLYFDKFKMALHADQTLSRDTLLEAANGRKVPALKIFSYALKYFRDHALKELSDQAGVEVLEEDVRWVITVPAIWSHPAKQFMRTAAYQAGMGSSSRPEQLLIALEPEAAAIYCRRLRRHQLLPERPPDLRPPKHTAALRETTPTPDSTSVPALPELDREELVSLPYRSVETVADWLTGETVYAVVDCGGGTVDITVHQMTDKSTGHLKELHKATGGPHGSTGVDGEFERLLETIFGADFLQTFRQQRPAAYVDLMIAFESRKRNASPYRSNPLNIALPFSFIDLYRKFRGKDVEWAMKKHQNLGVKWSAQGMLRVEQETMRQLFLPTLNSITQAIEAVLSAPEVGCLQYMFLVGGFAESELLQKHIRETFGYRVNVIIPQGMGLAILRGAVQFGLDPGVVTVRRSRLTYGVGVLNRYQRGLHPPDKRVVAAGSEWCADVLDRFVAVDESVAIGDVVVRPYTPATPGQSTVILHLYATDRHDAKFVTEDGVQRVGTLHLELGVPIEESSGSLHSSRREITVHMKFGDTEVKASAVDHLTGQIVRANIDFLAL